MCAADLFHMSGDIMRRSLSCSAGGDVQLFKDLSSSQSWSSEHWISTDIHKRGSLHTWLCFVHLHPLHPKACFTSARAETENSERRAKPVCHNSAEVLFADSQPGYLHFRNAFKRSYLQPRRAKRGRLALAPLKGLRDEMKWNALFDLCSINCEVMSAQACDKCSWIALTGATWCCQVPQGAAGFAEKTDTDDFT